MTRCLQRKSHLTPWHRFIRSLAIGFLVCIVTQSAAEEQPVTLQPLEVTAKPVIEENHLDAFSSLSAVVTEDQLRDQNALDLASALRRTPGVQITRFNPVGSFGGNEGGGVFIRGMGVSRPGSEITTYIDGIPVYMGVWGHPLLDLLPINGMQSISVYKGPQPQINGNNFASINLTTKRPELDGLHGGARLSGGMFGTFSEQADISGQFGAADFILAQGYARSDGHRDNADGELANVLGSLNYHLNAHWSAGVNFLYTNNTASDPGDNRAAKPAVAPIYDTEAGLVSINLQHDYDTLRGHLKLYTTTGQGNWFNHPNSPPFDNRITDTLTDFTTYGLRWQEEINPWTGGTVTIGVDSDWLSGAVKDSIGLAAVGGRYDTPTFRLASPYLAFSQDIPITENWTLIPSAGLRYYSHSEFDEELGPHAGISLASEYFTLYANFARGIHYPGLEVATLANYIPPLGDSWRNLSSERVDHGEVGFKFTPFKSTQLDVSFFNDRVKNRYVFAFPPLVSQPQFTKLGTYTMRGFEVALRQDIGADWSIFGSFTLLDPSIDTLPYTPERAVSVGVNGKLAGVHMALDAQYQSETLTLNRARNPEAVNNETVSSFVVVNARLSYPIKALGDRGEVFIAGENLLDRDYAYRPGYPMPGIWGQIGFSANF